MCDYHDQRLTRQLPRGLEVQVNNVHSPGTDCSFAWRHMLIDALEHVHCAVQLLISEEAPRCLLKHSLSHLHSHQQRDGFWSPTSPLTLVFNCPENGNPISQQPPKRIEIKILKTD